MGKKALVIGINYEGSPHSLRGCVNDAKNVYTLLSEKYGYVDANVRLLLDGKKDQDSVLFPTVFSPKANKGEETKKQADKPTRANIEEGIKWLVTGAKTGDYLFFHFSGHGGQVKDTDGDEADGMDECLFPLDFVEHGPIVDDELYRLLVKTLPNGAHLTVILDCCHSGTGLDLPFVFSTQNPNPEQKLEKKDKNKKDRGIEKEKDKKDKGKEKEKDKKKDKEKDKGKEKDKEKDKGKDKDKEKDKEKDKGKEKEKDKGKEKEHEKEKEKGGKEDKKAKKLEAKRLKKSEESKDEKKQRKDGDGSSVAAQVVLFSGCLDNQTSADTFKDGQPTGAMTYALVQTLHEGNADLSYINLLFKTRECVQKMGRTITQIPQLSSNDTKFDLHAKVAF